MGEKKGKECSEWVLKVTHETHFRGEDKQTSNPEGPGSHRHEWQRAPCVSGVLAQGLSEKWGGSGALPLWQTLKVTVACFKGQISALSVQNQGSMRQAFSEGLHLTVQPREVS